MPELHVRHAYPRDADTVWQRIRDFGDIQSWLPGVTGCQVQGEGVGAIRTVSVMDGSQVRERLERFDDAQRLFSYSIIEAPGMNSSHNYLATVQVKPNDDGGCEVHWSAHFDAGDTAAEKVEKLRLRAEKMYAFCLANLAGLLP